MAEFLDEDPSKIAMIYYAVGSDYDEADAEGIYNKLHQKID